MIEQLGGWDTYMYSNRQTATPSVTFSS